MPEGFPPLRVFSRHAVLPFSTTPHTAERKQSKRLNDIIFRVRVQVRFPRFCNALNSGVSIPCCSVTHYVASRCRLDVLYSSSMRTLAIGADSLPPLRKESSATLKLKVVVLCTVVTVMTALADGSRPRLFLRPHLLPGLRERCANGDLAGRYAGWRRDARRARRRTCRGRAVKRQYEDFHGHKLKRKMLELLQRY